MQHPVTSTVQYAGVTDTKLCIFCEIRDGRMEAALVAEDDHWLAFLDIHPLFPGHVLLVPRNHVTTLMELPDELVTPMMTATRALSRAVQKGMESDGIFVASNNGVSQSVDHLHIHVVPRRKKDGLRGFMWPRRKYESDGVMNETAVRIREALAQ
jgi:histidine triad (HIT) family protein